MFFHIVKCPAKQTKHTNVMLFKRRMKVLGSCAGKQLSLQDCGEFAVKPCVGLVRSECWVTSSVAQIHLHLS